jgi:hypothetical protein
VTFPINNPYPFKGMAGLQDLSVRRLPGAADYGTSARSQLALTISLRFACSRETHCTTPRRGRRQVNGSTELDTGQQKDAMLPDAPAKRYVMIY